MSEYVCFVTAVFKGLFFQLWWFKHSYGTAIYLTTVLGNTQFIIVLIARSCNNSAMSIERQSSNDWNSTLTKPDTRLFYDRIEKKKTTVICSIRLSY